ncbi:MAG TPA: glutamate--tRNA ligase [Dehalococcoidales bacterium]|nr:glutamate--tRNA ligase [Dehalococcoidales bacterium]
MDKPVRVRYAPSPTGFPHVGNIRTALFNWLWARHTGGKFLVRIEDTDTARTVPGSLESILDSLRWIGLDWDEGPEVGGPHSPYFQSQRLPLYHQAAAALVKSGHAYKCYCTAERLEAMRIEQQKNKVPPGYDRKCRSMSDRERQEMESQGAKSVIRFKVPLEGQTVFNDLLRGEVVFENRNLDDFVLLKTDGFPVYHLANVVDDHWMQISHVLRAEEWLSSTPRHILMYQALGYEPPVFAHMPLILGPDRSKLSKRHGAATLTEYRDQGYLPETMLNFLALLGWSLDEKTELFTRQQLVDNFSLERVSRTAGIFNREKLDWMNGVYLRGLSLDDYIRRALPFLNKELPPDVPRPLDENYLRGWIPLIKDRARTLAEIPQLGWFFYQDKLSIAPADILIKNNQTLTLDIYHKIEDTLERVPFNKDDLEKEFRAMAASLTLKPGELFNSMRTAVTGRTVSPPLFETMVAMGKSRVLKRFQDAVQKISGS